MTPQQLKNSILQMAMQGKLVEQRPEEGTGEELYQKIQKEKQKLIKEGKIKKQKPLPEITEDEVPFEIPESWKWVRLGSVIDLLSGADLTPDKYNSEQRGIVYITGASCIDEDHVLVNRWTEYPKNIAHKGDILLTCKGTVGKTAILDIEQAHIARQIMAITPIICDADYLTYYLHLIVKSLKKKAKSMIPGIDRKSVLYGALPLPPLAEQKRIVAKIEEIMPYIDRYAVAYDHLQSYNTRFPDDLKKSILQMAVEGQLSSQWRLDNRGDLDSWRSMTVLDVCHDVKVGIVIRPTRYYTDSTGYKAFRSMNVREFYVQDSDWVYVNQKGQDENPRTVVHTGDVLIVRSGNTGTACVVPEKYDGCSGIDIIIAVPNQKIIDPEFLCIFTNSPVGKAQISSLTKGMALTHFGAKSYAKLHINVPSLEEQHYIINQVKRIMPRISMLSKR